MLVPLSEEQAEQQLADLNRPKNEFLAMLSHELRNPLAPILNAVQLLQLALAAQSAPNGTAAPARRTLRVVVVNDNLEAAKILRLLVRECGHRIR